MEDTDRDRRQSRSRSRSKGRKNSVDETRATRQRDHSISRSKEVIADSTSSIHGVAALDDDSKLARVGVAAAGNRTNSNMEAPSMINQGDVSSQISADYVSAGTKQKGQLEEVSNEIFFLERDIADLNRQYKDMLAKSQESSSATVLSNLRIDLNNIARLLEEKSEKLFELKKQQQLALKTSY